MLNTFLQPVDVYRISRCQNIASGHTTSNEIPSKMAMPPSLVIKIGIKCTHMRVIGSWEGVKIITKGTKVNISSRGMNFDQG